MGHFSGGISQGGHRFRVPRRMVAHGQLSVAADEHPAAAIGLVSGLTQQTEKPTRQR